MNFTELLTAIKSKDIVLSAQDGRLRVNAPRDVLDEELRTHIAHHRDALLQYLQSKDAVNNPTLSELRRENRTDACPLSMAQHGFYMLDKLDPGQNGLNLVSVRAILGPLQLEKFALTLQRVVARHDALRTRFERCDDAVVQIVDERVHARLEIIDATELTCDLSDALVSSLLTERPMTNFSLEDGPLIRALLVTHAADRYTLIVALHHIIADAHSVEQIFFELATLYASDQNLELPQLQYTDYAQWESDLLDSGTLDAQIDYWRSELQNIPTLIRQPMPQLTFERQIDTLHVSWPDELQDHLVHLCGQLNATPSDVTLSLFTLSLCQQFSAFDVPVVLPTSDRNKFTSSTVGLFVSSVIIRTSFNHVTCLRDLVDSVKFKVSEALENRLISIEKLESIARVRKLTDLRLDALSRIGFNFIRTSDRDDELDLGDVRISTIPVERKASPFDFMLVVHHGRSKFAARLEYSRGLIDPAQAQAICENLTTLLTQLKEHSGVDDSLLDLVSCLEPPVGPSHLVHEKLPAGWRRYLTSTSHQTPEICLVDTRSVVIASMKDAERSVRTLAHRLGIEDKDSAIDAAMTVHCAQDNVSFSDEFAHWRRQIDDRCPLNVLIGATDTGQSTRLAISFSSVLDPNTVAQQLQLALAEESGIPSVTPWCKKTQGCVRRHNAQNEQPKLAMPLLPLRQARNVDASSMELQAHTAQVTVPATLTHGIAQFCQQNDIAVAQFYEALVALAVARQCEPVDAPIIWSNLGSTDIETDGIMATMDAISYPAITTDQTVCSWILGSRVHRSESLMTGRTAIHEAAIQLVFRAWSLDVDIEIRSNASAVQNLHVDLVETPTGTTLTVCQESVQSFDEFFLDRVLCMAQRSVSEQRSVSQISLESRAETTALASVMSSIAESNETHFVQLFDAAVAQHGQNTAIALGSETSSYATCAKRSHELAGFLANNKVQTGNTVGVCLTRNLDLIPLIIAIWRLGAVYLPIDPSTPDARLKHMVTSSDCQIVVSDLDREFASARLLQLTPDQQFCDTPDREKSAPALDSDSLAYIIFTSGSTGQPKGVRVRHRNLANILLSMRASPGVAPSDRWLAATAITFDISLVEMFAPLVASATVVLLDDTSAANPGLAIAAIESGDVTIFQATPSTWRLLLACGWEGNDKLKVICGGEALDAGLAKALLGNCREVWNAYGPTETTVWSMIGQITSPVTDVDIGQAVAGTQLYIVDEFLNPVPAGTAGELVILGAGVADGYVGADAHAAAAFFIWQDTAQAAYRTGDRVTLDADNKVVYLGRADRQVKTRGYRIELGDVEAAANEITQINDSAAYVIQRDSSNSTLALAVGVGDHQIDTSELRHALAKRLPDYMMPAEMLIQRTLPRLSSGKLDRKSIEQQRPVANLNATDEHHDVKEQIANIWKDALKNEDFTYDQNFFDVGGHSILLVDVHRQLVEAFDVSIQPIDLFEHASVDKMFALVIALSNDASDASTPISAVRRSKLVTADSDIAVIGVAARFPGASNIKQFWSNLLAGTESIRDLSDDELGENHVPEWLASQDNYVRRAATLDDIGSFDTSLFNISPREASILDPQHRLILELTYQSIEDAGYDFTQFEQRVGLFAGIGLSSYLIYNLWPSREKLLDTTSPLELLYANDKDYAVTRAAYLLNLRGPCVAVGTACSSGLVAIHQACQSIRNGDCEMALAAAAKIAVPHDVGYVYQPGGIMSQNGECRPFDAQASGTVFGSGGACVLLKPKAQAVLDGDNIYGLIRGSSVNNDGNEKVGFTAPSLVGQVNAIVAAQENAGIDPHDVDYIETHGTGTRLGDPIEIAALARVFTQGNGEKRRRPIGSVKANIGHLDNAAGMAGFVKCLLAVRERRIPPQIHFSKANPQIDFDTSPFFVNTKAAQPDATGRPMNAGISSFGIGGTNAHVILSEFISDAPAQSEQEKPREDQAALIVLSAASRSSLALRATDLLAYLDEHPDADINSLAHTLMHDRPNLPFRRAFVTCDVDDTKLALMAMIKPSSRAKSTPDSGRVAFLFPGQGIDLTEQAAQLYQSNRIFAECIDQYADVLSKKSTIDLVETLHRSSATPATTDVIQPVLLCVELAIATLCERSGLSPSIILSHSAGETAAACFAGVLDLETAIELSVIRGRAMQAAPAGSMLAVFCSESELSEHLSDSVKISAYNDANVLTASGPQHEIARLCTDLDVADITFKKLAVDRAFHTPDMRSAAAAVASFLQTKTLSSPRIPIVASATGEIDSTLITSPEYWARQILNPVQFAKSLAAGQFGKSDVMIEVAPGRTLTKLAAMGKPNSVSSMVSLPGQAHAHKAWPEFLQMLGNAWCDGQKLDWSAIVAQRPVERLRLPTYQFDRSRHWVDRVANGSRTALATERLTPDKWTYQESWSREFLSTRVQLQHKEASWVVCCGRDNSTAQIGFAKRLAAAGHQVIILASGDRQPDVDFAGPIHWGNSAETFDAPLRGWLKTRPEGPVNIANFWFLDEYQTNSAAALCKLMLGLVSLCSASNGDATMLIVTHCAFNVTGNECVLPGQRAIHGAARVLNNEFANINVVGIDCDTTSLQDSANLTSIMTGEAACSAKRNAVAFRHSVRWLRKFQPIELNPGSRDSGAFAPKLCVVVGGLGGLGQRVCQHLADIGARHIVIVGRSSSSDVANPNEWLVQQPGPDGKKAPSLTGEPVAVEYTQCDVSNESEFFTLIENITANHQSIDLLVHCAGVADGTLCQLATPSSMERIYSSKMIGGQIACDAALAHGVHRTILFSSLTSIAGEIGQFAYAAANSFLDGLAETMRARGLDCTSIAWDTWRETGMAHRVLNEGGPSSDVLGQRIALGLDSESALQIFDSVCLESVPGIIVSTVDLNARLAHSISLKQATDRLSVSAPGEESDRDADWVAPSTPVEKRLAKLWQETLGTTEVGVDEDYFALGGTSLHAIKLVGSVVDQLGIPLDPNTLIEHPTIRQLAAHIEKLKQTEATPEPDTLLVALNSNRFEAPPLYMIHPIGGQVYYYRELAAELDHQGPIIGIRAADPSNLDDSRVSVSQLARHYLSLIKPSGSDPIYLAGSSLGGMIAYEMAHQLEQAGAPTDGVIMIDTPGPSDNLGKFETPLDVLEYLTSEMPDWEWVRPFLQRDTEDEVLRSIARAAQELPATTQYASTEQLRSFLQYFLAQMDAMRDYVVPTLDTRVLYVKAIERRLNYDVPEPQTVWQSHAKRMAVSSIAGNHITIHSKPFVGELARVMSDFLFQLSSSSAKANTTRSTN